MKIDIYGAIIDGESEREDLQDVSPVAFREMTEGLKSGDELEIHMNSCGGNVTAGISIANLIRSMNREGVKTVCTIDGVCCSIASVIACACQKILMYPESFMMVHNPWCVVMGDSEDLRKEAKNLDQMKKAILSFYHEKFDSDDSILEAMMDEETWISGSDAKHFGLDVELIYQEEPVKIAAKLIGKMKKFNNKQILERISKMEKEDIKEIEKEEEVKTSPCDSCSKKGECEKECPDGCEEKVEKAEEVEKTVEEKTEEKVEEYKPTVEELLKVIEELEAKIAELEKKEEETPVEERVSKMQSVMQNKLNVQHKDFTDKLELKERELSGYKDQVSTLTQRLETAERELSEKASALEEKTTALAKLNASVLTPSEETDWKSLHGQEFFDYIKEHNIR